MKSLSKIVSFAIDAHEKVNHRYDGHAYSVHLSMVAQYAVKYQYAIVPHEHVFESIVLPACWLHDTIEDCRLTYNDLKEFAGEKIADIVYALTNEKGKTRKERANESYYRGIRSEPFAIFVKLCDRLANVRYSVDTGSKMQIVYKRENEEFIENLLKWDSPHLYKPAVQDMVKELKDLLQCKDQ